MKRARPAGAICVAHQPTPLIRSNLSARSALICALVAASAACGSDPVAKSDASADETVGSADGVANEADSQSDAAELDSSAVDDTSVASETSTEDTTPSDVACKSDKDCLALDQVCNKTAGFCVQCNDSNDCGDDETCKGNSCVGPPQKCASSKDCADANQLCDKVAGICVECVTVDDCAAGQSCQDTVCVDVACKPGATGCKDATTLSICADDGLSAVSVPCPTGQGCAEGTCTTATVCKPGASACEGQLTLLSCNGDGSAWIKTPCEVKHLCATKGGSSLCEAATCTPGALVCVGDKIAECSSTGEPSDISDDCALKGKTCEAGLCVDKPVGVCSSGSKLCEGDSAKVCKADGGAWESVDCTVDSKVCKDGACVAPPPVCTAGELGCDGGATKTVCKADGSGWDATPCGSQSACNAGVCEKTLCTPGAHDCVDGKTEKSCAPDGKSWTDVTTCATTNSCAEVSCQANVGCTTTPLADGAGCGGGKICASGACVAPSGCQLCGPAQTCVSGQCQACTPVDVPVYVGAIRTFTPPAEQLPGPMQLVYSPKHAEWWLVYNHQLGKPGKIVRYNKDWSSTGKEFALPPYTRSIAVLPDGDFVMAILPNSGNSWLKRFKALSQDVVWSKEVTWGDFGVSGVVLWQDKIMTNVKMKFSNASRWATIDPATGAKLTEKQVSSDGGLTGVSAGFTLGDNLYSASGASMQRWILAPVLALVTTYLIEPPWYGPAGVSFGFGGFDGRTACIGMASWAGRMFCYDFFPGCGGSPPSTLPFPGSTILSSDEQLALAKFLGTDGKVWTRCAPSPGKSGFSAYASTCAGGPTIVIGAEKTVTNGKSAFIGAYSSTGWSPTAGTKVTDSKAYLFSLPSGVKAVPQSGIATLTTTAKDGPLIDGGLTCTNVGCKYELTKFACDDGSSAADCLKKLSVGGLTSFQGFNEMWVLKP